MQKSVDCTPPSPNGSVVRFTPAFFDSFTVTVFVPDSAVAAQICPPKCLQGPPMVISKKYFDIRAHPETKWHSQKNIQIFCCCLISLFFSSIYRHNFDRTVAIKSSVPSRICLVKKGDSS